MQKVVDLIVFAGQSNMAGRGIVDAQHPQPAPALIPGAGYEYRAVSNPNGLSVLQEPFGATEDRLGGINDQHMKTGSLVTSFVNTWFELTGIPVVGVSASKGGSRIEEWLPGGCYLNDLIQRLCAARAFLAQGDFQIRHCMMLWCQGESDGDAATPPAVYQQRFGQMRTALQRHGIEDILLIPIGCYNGRDPHIDYTPIRRAQEQLCRMIPHVYLVSTAFAGMKARGLMKDDFHYYQQAYNEVGTDAAQNAVRMFRQLQKITTNNEGLYNETEQKYNFTAD